MRGGGQPKGAWWRARGAQLGMHGGGHEDDNQTQSACNQHAISGAQLGMHGGGHEDDSQLGEASEQPTRHQAEDVSLD